MVNPGGTGRPSALISQRLAPLPPSRFRMSARPSAEPPPNRYTHFAIITFLLVVALLAGPLRFGLGFDLREISDRVQGRADGGEKAQAVGAQRRVRIVDRHAVEEVVDRRAQV